MESDAYAYVAVIKKNMAKEKNKAVPSEPAIHIFEKVLAATTFKIYTCETVLLVHSAA